MTVREKFETLDMLILDKFDRVSQGAHKRFGWSKYDLAQKANVASLGFFSGWGIYNMFGGYMIDNPFLIGCGGLMVAAAPLMYSINRKKDKADEDKELEQILRDGSPNTPNPDPMRPAFLGAASAFLVAGVSYMILGDNPPERVMEQVTTDEYGNVRGLSTICMSGWYVCQMIRSYFRDTTMQPPKAKKNVFRAIYEKLVPMKALPQGE